MHKTVATRGSGAIIEASIGIDAIAIITGFLTLMDKAIATARRLTIIQATIVLTTIAIVARFGAFELVGEKGAASVGH